MYTYSILHVAMLDDIEQGFGKAHSDSRDLKQLQLEQTRIKVLILFFSV